MVFKKGSRGEEVKQIQLALGVKVDGDFGVKTENAVIKFQKENGLYPDGIVGKKTLEKLNIKFDSDLSIIKPFDLSIDEYHLHLPKGEYLNGNYKNDYIILHHTDGDANDLSVDEYHLPKGEYLNGNYKNDYIILHHTAGGANPRNVIDSWANDMLGKVATEFVIGGQNCKSGDTKYDGQIVRAFPEGCQGYHIGTSGSSYMNTHSVGIEMCNFGYINGGMTYTGSIANPEQIISLNVPFKGYLFWHKYSDEQIKAVRDLLLYISNRDNVDLHEGLYKWIKTEGVTKAFDFHINAYKGEVKGLLTHTNIREDKFDCSPQPNLVDMILSL